MSPGAAPGSFMKVGIDLGTTNSALAWIDPADAEDTSFPPIHVFDIPQLVAAGRTEPRRTLPSFLFLDEGQPVGAYAREQGAIVPTRLVHSAKSWLSNPDVDRTAKILPWDAGEGGRVMSPVEVSARLIATMRDAWDKAGRPPLAEQDVVLTVPASFDEEARELTVKAAAEAGLTRLTLLEEPQAACYAWIDSTGDGWRSHLRAGDLLLVCDIGGGTTDFSLILVGEHDGDLALERVAIGDHILLGGDNMDLALARLVQQRLEGEGHRLDTWQLQALWHQCRVAKETLFAQPDQHTHAVTVLGKGTRLIGGTIRGELRRDDLDAVLVNGFFPAVSANEMPARRRLLGLQELGLPYAADPAVTRHLARFLSRQAAGSPASSSVRRGRGGLVCPTHLLFNGGGVKTETPRARVFGGVKSWVTPGRGAPPRPRHR